MAHSEATTKFDPAMHRVVGAAITDLAPEKDWVVGVAIADWDPKDYGVGCLSLNQHDAVARCTNIQDPAAEIGWAYGHVGLRGPGWFPANYCLFARAATTTTSIRGTASSSSSVTKAATTTTASIRGTASSSSSGTKAATTTTNGRLEWSCMVAGRAVLELC